MVSIFKTHKQFYLFFDSRFLSIIKELGFPGSVLKNRNRILRGSVAQRKDSKHFVPRTFPCLCFQREKANIVKNGVGFKTKVL
jgi:hypothetical protein